MMVDDPYRHYSTWIASREVAKGDYSELIDSILRGETLNLDYLRNYVTNVFEQKGRELLLNRKCSDTNNTCYFIVTFFIKFLRSAYEAQVSQQVKHEHVDSEETQMPSLQILEKSIETLERRKSFYSVKQLVNNRALRDFIRTNFLESNQFLLAVLTYERITSLTVKNIIEKYGELLEMFQWTLYESIAQISFINPKPWDGLRVSDKASTKIYFLSIFVFSFENQLNFDSILKWIFK